MVQLRLVRKRAPNTGRLNVYRCQFCKSFHVGHAPGSGLRPA